MTRGWPRIYSTTIPQRAAMTEAELSALWAEYTAFWRGHEGHSNPTPASDDAKDRAEDVEGLYR